MANIELNVTNLVGGSIQITTPAPSYVLHPETIVTYSDGTTATYNFSGTIQSRETDGPPCHPAELVRWSDIVQIDIGSDVTSLGMYCLSPDVTAGESDSLRRVIIPPSVISFSAGMPFGYSSVEEVTFLGRTIAETQEFLSNNPMDKSGCVVHCSDGDFTLT